MEILETVHKLQEPAAFVTWSKQIAYHKCTAYFRKRKELLVDENEDGYTVFDAVEEDREEFIPDAALDHADLRKSILGMINELPEEQKSAIVLRYFNEISVKEIAQIQGVNEGTVKSRLNYGRKSIKKAVEEYEKKNGIRLHCVGVLPLLLWFFKNYRISSNLHISSQTAMQAFVVGEETAGAAAAVGSATAASAGAAAAATATSAGTAVAASTVAAGLSAKVVAIIAAAAVAVGGVAAGIAVADSRSEEPTQAVIATYEEETAAPFATEAAVTEPTEETTEVPTQASTEVPTEAPTEAPAITATEPPVTEGPTEPPVTEPPATEPSATQAPTEAPAEDGGCDHSMTMVSQLYGYDYINETWQCSVCGYQEYVNYPNPCNHVGQLREDYIMVCVNCGLAMGYYPPEEAAP